MERHRLEKSSEGEASSSPLVQRQREAWVPTQNSRKEVVTVAEVR